jgi:cytoskeletal protein CcmA (bactofilin family)
MSDSNKRRLRDAASGPGTLISQGCKVEGLLTGTGNFMINGEVEGECNVEGTVTLAQSGCWNGVIRASSVIVAGSIDGDIIAAGPVEIGDTARISGTVTGEAIAVAEGAVVEGVMKTTGQNAPQEFVEKRQQESEEAD